MVWCSVFFFYSSGVRNVVGRSVSVCVFEAHFSASPSLGQCLFFLSPVSPPSHVFRPTSRFVFVYFGFSTASSSSLADRFRPYYSRAGPSIFFSLSLEMVLV